MFGNTTTLSPAQRDDMRPVEAAVNALIEAHEEAARLDRPEFVAAKTGFRLQALPDDHPLAEIELDDTRQAKIDKADARLAAGRPALAAALRRFFEQHPAVQCIQVLDGIVNCNTDWERAYPSSSDTD